MEKILLLGDSWGVPNYNGPPGICPDQHTEYLLLNLGYEVVNFSMNGNGNDIPISKAISYVDRGNNIDWIVWFHTEMLRDRHLIDLSKPYKISDLVHTTSEYVYKKFHMLKNKSQAKILIVGGQAPVLNNCVGFDYIIKDWRSEICNQVLPIVHSLTHLDLIEHENCIDTIKDKTILLEKHNIILSAMEKSEHFPDKCHPGVIPHLNLSKFINEIINKK